MKETFLVQAVVYLAAAVLTVPLARRLGLGSVLGYLLAGIAVGPHVLGLVGEEGHDVMHFAEFGVVMMLFLVGLELRPSLLWRMRAPIFGLGGAQVALTLLLVALLAAALGLSWPVAIVLGMIASASSTAIALQSLGEKGLLGSEGGRASFAVLLFQDIAVIPMLAVIPLLASGEVERGHGAGRPGWLSALMILGAVLLIVIGGRFLMRPIFRYLAASRLREVLTAAALLLVLGVALLMESVGLSPALGTFLAGVLLADSEYRHQLETDIEPFKGLLLGVFFIAVGASIDFALLGRQPLLLSGATALAIALKAAVLFALASAFRLERGARVVLTLGLAQIGEFAFVLVSFAQQSGVLAQELASSVVVVVAMSMLVAPLLFLLLDRVVLPRLAPAVPAREPDAIEPGADHVVMAGFGRMGQIAGRLLRQTGVEVTVLDLDPEIIDVVRRVGSAVYYGDASRLDLLHAAGCERARAFVVCIDDADKTLEIVELVRAHFPHLPIVARAADRVQFYKLRQLGVEHVVRETYESALTMGELTLRVLGRRAHEAHRAAGHFRHYEHRATERLATLWGKVEGTAFFTEVRDALAQTEDLMRQDLGRKQESERGWDNESLRADVQERGKVD